MKKWIKSSQTISATTADDYDRYFTYNRGGQKFSGYIKYEDDPDNLQFTLSEVHPYDDAEYTWAKKDSPVEIKLIKDGHIVGSLKQSALDFPEYDEEDYESPEEYVDTVIDITANVLRQMNRDIEPRMMHW